ARLLAAFASSLVFKYLPILPRCPSAEFALHRLIARLQFGHELYEFGTAPNPRQVGVTGEHRIVRHTRFHGLAEPAHRLRALAFECENRCERVVGVVDITELLRFVKVRWNGGFRILKSSLHRRE